MKFACERDVLVEALGTAGRAIATRGGSLPVLSGIRFDLNGDRLRLTGTDLELTISAEIDVAGEHDGSAVLQGRIVGEVVRSLEQGRVHVSAEDDEAHISAGRFESSMRLLPIEEYPRLPELTEGAVTVAAEDLPQALRQVVRAASSDDSRPILTGVLLSAEEGGGLRLVATDSYRLAVRDVAGTSVLREGQSVLVPSRALREVERLLSGVVELTLRLGERDATFEVSGAGGTTRLTTRLIEGEFPNYRGLIPQHQPNRLRVGREPLLEAVRRVRLMAREATPLRLAMNADGLELIAITQDVGEAHEQLEVKYEGAELTVAFNPEYLLDGIEVAPGDEISLETVDAQKPAVLRGSEGNSDFLYLLMPVRVS